VLALLAWAGRSAAGQCLSVCRCVGVPGAPAEGPTIHIGGLESYEARCRRCHVVPAVTRAQIGLME
jgi:thymidine kinase